MVLELQSPMALSPTSSFPTINTSNAHGVVTIKLDGTNYLMWYTQVEPILVSSDLIRSSPSTALSAPHQVLSLPTMLPSLHQLCPTTGVPVLPPPNRVPPTCTPPSTPPPSPTCGSPLARMTPGLDLFVDLPLHLSSASSLSHPPVDQVNTHVMTTRTKDGIIRPRAWTITCHPIPIALLTQCKDEVKPRVEPYKFSNQKVKNLGLKLTPVKQCLYETVKSLQEKSHHPLPSN
ncbi:hypothetical protein HHK36_032312 [Tetracentron sinense]|uniref:Uncharacterized protein n=1 Tax=Tetracentron sinense TaxID=13715 RepID=A0A834YAG2_TETSI|nr:hypothetical protein HHK36_032312 [Tetracentron sinense]